MTGASEARVRQRAEEVAEEVASAANIVTNAGYYEIDIDAVTAVIARFEADVTQSATAPLIEALEAAREDCERLGEALHKLSAALLANGVFEHDNVHGPYEAVVNAWKHHDTRLTAALAAHEGEG